MCVCSSNHTLTELMPWISYSLGYSTFYWATPIECHCGAMQTNQRLFFLVNTERVYSAAGLRFYERI